MEWPDWEKAIQTELTPLNNMGTWKLVKNPSDRAPISNKWVFLQNFTKTEELLKYKAQLVAKGYVQRPGYDFDQMFSPVI